MGQLPSALEDRSPDGRRFYEAPEIVRAEGKTQDTTAPSVSPEVEKAYAVAGEYQARALEAEAALASAREEALEQAAFNTDFETTDAETLTAIGDALLASGETDKFAFFASELAEYHPDFAEAYVADREQYVRQLAAGAEYQANLAAQQEDGNVRAKAAEDFGKRKGLGDDALARLTAAGALAQPLAQMSP